MEESHKRKITMTKRQEKHRLFKKIHNVQLNYPKMKSNLKKLLQKLHQRIKKNEKRCYKCNQ